MKVDCTLFNIGYDFLNKRTKLEFFVDGDITSSVEKYLDKKMVLELKKAKRSLDCNAYFWSLLGELQEKLKIPKEDLYKHYIAGCGVYEVMPIRDEAVDRFIECWQHNGLRMVL